MGAHSHWPGCSLQGAICLPTRAPPQGGLEQKQHVDRILNADRRSSVVLSRPSLPRGTNRRVLRALRAAGTPPAKRPARSSVERTSHPPARFRPARHGGRCGLPGARWYQPHPTPPRCEPVRGLRAMMSGTAAAAKVVDAHRLVSLKDEAPGLAPHRRGETNETDGTEMARPGVRLSASPEGSSFRVLVPRSPERPTVVPEC